MHIPKQYIHDRLILLLISANTFFAILTTVNIILKYSSSADGGFTYQYRPTLGFGGYIRGDKSEILSFAIFVMLVLFIHTFLSIKVFNIKKQLSIAILGTALLLILMALVISYSLLLLP